MKDTTLISSSFLEWEVFYSLSSPRARRGRKVSFNEVTEVVVLEMEKKDWIFNGVLAKKRNKY